MLAQRALLLPADVPAPSHRRPRLRGRSHPGPRDRVHQGGGQGQHRCQAVARHQGGGENDVRPRPDPGKDNGSCEWIPHAAPHINCPPPRWQWQDPARKDLSVLGAGRWQGLGRHGCDLLEKASGGERCWNNAVRARGRRAKNDPWVYASWHLHASLDRSASPPNCFSSFSGSGRGLKLTSANCGGRERGR